MGLCGSREKIPENFQGPFIFTGDSNGIMRQHAFINNKIKLFKKYFQVHQKEGGGIKVMAPHLNDELLTTLDGNGLIQCYATQRQLRIFYDRFVEIKLTTAISYSSDNKFAFLGNKFGKINQWDNVKKSIFNIWHFVTPGRIITSMFCSKIIILRFQQVDVLQQPKQSARTITCPVGSVTTTLKRLWRLRNTSRNAEDANTKGEDKK